jgi:hypothetical protein
LTIAAQKIRCREITETDIDAVADLLARGFHWRPRAYWMQGLRRQAAREVPEGYPRFGYMVDHEGLPVGVLLLIYSTREDDNAQDDNARKNTASADGATGAIYCNLSSWYVEPPFRNYAALLTKIAQRNKEVTYVNISPAVFTWPIIEAQGFRSYCCGLFFSFPLLSRVKSGMTIETVSADAKAVDGLTRREVELLTRHAHYGCLSLVCRTATRETLPFILSPVRIRRGWMAPPAMQMIYCRDIEDYVRCAGIIGRLLLPHGKISVLLDSNGPIPGLLGIHTRVRGRKYFKGPQQPRLADLTDTEVVVYGP